METQKADGAEISVSGSVRPHRTRKLRDGKLTGYVTVVEEDESARIKVNRFALYA